MLRKSGFTLAEVLLTLVVIGVIAALTIPALIQNTQKRQYVTALQKAYSNLVQVVNLIKNDNAGTLVGALGSNTNETINIFANKMTFTRICYGEGAGICWHSGNEKTLDGTDAGWNAGSRDSAVLLDGSSIQFYRESAGCSINFGGGVSNVCYTINVDINGLAPPNTLGRDNFYFWITKDRVIPYGNQTGLWGCISNSDYEDSSGCALKILTEGAMNY